MSVDFSILTYNIYIGHPFFFLEGKHSLIQSFRLESQIGHIKDLEPDIFCLQEVYSSQILDVYKRNFPQYGCFYETDYISFHRVLLFFLIGILTYYILRLPLSAKYIFLFLSFFFYSCYYLLFYTTAGMFLNGNIKTANVIFYKQNKFRFKSGEVFLFNNQDGDILNIVRKRGFIFLKLIYNEKEINIINSHLSNKQEFCETHIPINSNINRYEQIEQLIKNIKKKQGNIIVCGDFNAATHTLEIKNLKQYLQSSPMNSQEKCTWAKKNKLTTLFHQVEDHQSDYIFYSGLQCSTSKIVFDDVEPNISDHYGVLSSFTLI